MPTASHLLRAHLAPHIHMAWRDADIVVLDVAADSYACLVDASTVLRSGPEAGVILASDPDVIEDLSQAGWLVDEPSSHRTLIAPSSVLQPLRSTNPALPFGALLNGLGSTVRFRKTALPGLIRLVAARNARLKRSDPLAAAQALAAFETVQPWLPFAGDCLQRAFLLHAHLHACGLASDWVFGVRTWPFLAHCWIQIDDVVLGETLERARAFTPILRV
ncbi:lasso peptide biosynthesis B2 protein [Brevundimonas sp.]|nr:MAG: lasso peptide biosynthesis B2 protein [Brevundimonas sp.]